MSTVAKLNAWQRDALDRLVKKLTADGSRAHLIAIGVTGYSIKDGLAAYRLDVLVVPDDDLTKINDDTLVLSCGTKLKINSRDQRMSKDYLEQLLKKPRVCRFDGEIVSTKFGPEIVHQEGFMPPFALVKDKDDVTKSGSMVSTTVTDAIGVVNYRVGMYIKMFEDDDGTRTLYDFGTFYLRVYPDKHDKLVSMNLVVGKTYLLRGIKHYSPRDVKNGLAVFSLQGYCAAIELTEENCAVINLNMDECMHASNIAISMTPIVEVDRKRPREEDFC